VVVVASIVLVLQVALDCGDRGTCEWSWVRAIIFGVVSLPMTAFVAACIHMPKLGSVKKLALLVLCLWWCGAVVLVTFAAPYVLMGTAYLACWAAFAATGLLLRAELPSLGNDVREMAANETSCDTPVSDAKPVSLAKEYEGHFSHPCLGSGSIDIRVEVKSPRSGMWVFLGEAETVAVACPSQRRICMSSSDSNQEMVFDGVMDTSGVIRGVVLRAGEGGGNFHLLPKSTSMFGFLGGNSNTKRLDNTVTVTAVTDQATLNKIQELFDKTWQDRAYQGQHKVQKLKVVQVERVSNTKVRKQYFDCLQQLKDRSLEQSISRDRLPSHDVDASAFAPDLDPAINEALMFHGSSPDGAAAILRSRVKVMSNGAAHGDLYGPGCYFADTVSKADTYAKPRGDGLCGMVISRVVLGNIYTTTEETPVIKDLLRKVNSGDYHTICGDRRKINRNFGGWKEYITFDEQRSLPLFLAWYRRV